MQSRSPERVRRSAETGAGEFLSRSRQRTRTRAKTATHWDASTGAGKSTRRGGVGNGLGVPIFRARVVGSPHDTEHVRRPRRRSHSRRRQASIPNRADQAIRPRASLLPRAQSPNRDRRSGERGHLHQSASPRKCEGLASEASRREGASHQPATGMATGMVEGRSRHAILTGVALVW